MSMRRRPMDAASRPPKRPVVKRPSDQGPGLLQYVKVMALWAALLTVDQLFEQRLELLIPLWSLWRSVLYIQRVDGAAMIGLFLCVSLLVDFACLWFVPIHWLFFIGSIHIWVQILWQTDPDLYFVTIILFITCVFVEATWRLHTLPILYGYKLLAAHCTGSPAIMLVLDVKELLKFHLRKNRRKQVEAENRFHLHLVEGSLPPPMRIQCNEYVESEKDDSRYSSSSSKTLNLATAQDLEAQSQNHSGIILWLLRLIFRRVSKWLGNSPSGKGSTGVDNDSDSAAGGNDGIDGGRQSKETGNGYEDTVPVETLSAHSSSGANSTSGLSSSGMSHRRRHDARESKLTPQTGRSSKVAAASAAAAAQHSSEHFDSYSLGSVMPGGGGGGGGGGGSGNAHSVHHVASDGGGGGSGGVHNGVTNRGNSSGGGTAKTVADERGSIPTRTTGGDVRDSKKGTVQSPVATVAPVASTRVQQPPTSRKDTRLQQELSQLKSKFMASREREDRLNDQVDDLRDGVCKSQQDLKDTQQELQHVQNEADSLRRQLRAVQDSAANLQKDCDAKDDQVAAARSAHDDAERALRDFTHKVSADSSIHQACNSTQMSLQRECERRTLTISHIEQQLSAEKARCQRSMRDNEKLKADNVTLERKLGKEIREKMELVSSNRDMRQRLETKTKECARLEQQITEALAVMPINPFLPSGKPQELAFSQPPRLGSGRQSSLFGSMDDSWDKAMQFGSQVAGGDGDEEAAVWPSDLTPPTATAIKKSKKATSPIQD